MEWRHTPQEGLTYEELKPTNNLSDKAYCVTGQLQTMTKMDAKRAIEKAGGIFRSNGSSRVQYMVLGGNLPDGRSPTEGRVYRDFVERCGRSGIIDEATFREHLGVPRKVMTQTQRNVSPPTGNDLSSSGFVGKGESGPGAVGQEGGGLASSSSSSQPAVLPSAVPRIEKLPAQRRQRP